MATDRGLEVSTAQFLQHALHLVPVRVAALRVSGAPDHGEDLQDAPRDARASGF